MINSNKIFDMSRRNGAVMSGIKDAYSAAKIKGVSVRWIRSWMDWTSDGRHFRGGLTIKGLDDIGASELFVAGTVQLTITADAGGVQLEHFIMRRYGGRMITSWNPRDGFKNRMVTVSLDHDNRDFAGQAKLMLARISDARESKREVVILMTDGRGECCTPVIIGPSGSSGMSRPEVIKLEYLKSDDKAKDPWHVWDDLDLARIFVVVLPPLKGISITGQPGS